MKFKVGDRVILNKNIKDFVYGRGYVSYDEIGIIREIKESQEIIVDFSICKNWRGLKKELILISSNNKKTFFKKLPNNYTGTIEVENGYIVEKEILDEKEKEYLNAVIRPFKDRVVGIKKKIEGLGDQYEYIWFVMNRNIDKFSLPSFEKGTMYKGMKTYKEYTLKELGLDD